VSFDSPQFGSQKKLPHLQKPRQSCWQFAAFSLQAVSQKPSPQFAQPPPQSDGHENWSSPHCASQTKLPHVQNCAQSCWQLIGLSQLGLQKPSPHVHACPQSCGQENGSSKQLA
jgi:hypothetical protein